VRGVFLDYRSVDPGDLDRSVLKSVLPAWDWHGATTNEQLAERIADAEVIVSNKVPLQAQVLTAAPKLRLICIAATGADKVDLTAAGQLGIQVSNVTGYAAPSVVQHVFTLMLALSTNLLRYHRDVTDGSWQAQDQFCLLDHPISELAGKTLGILGYGELGKGVARVARAFGMKVLVARRPGAETVEDDRMPWRELLPQVDVLSLHVPLVQNTRMLIGETELALMKSSALLINTARGGIVDEYALAKALRAGEIGGAGIDVLGVEPPAADNPLLANDIPNLILTPHTAWASRESRQRLLDEIALNIGAFSRGEARNSVL
jgi:glycerate dehydrogenase